jgi:transcriptional regulator with XRE-family HTH domain
MATKGKPSRASKKPLPPLSARLDGEVLRRLRRSAGLNQEETARAWGIRSESTISKVESGERELRLSEVPVYLKAFGKGILDFLSVRRMVVVEWAEHPPQGGERPTPEEIREALAKFQSYPEEPDEPPQEP